MLSSRKTPDMATQALIINRTSCCVQYMEDIPNNESIKTDILSKDNDIGVYTFKHLIPPIKGFERCSYSKFTCCICLRNICNFCLNKNILVTDNINLVRNKTVCQICVLKTIFTPFAGDDSMANWFLLNNIIEYNKRERLLFVECNCRFVTNRYESYLLFSHLFAFNCYTQNFCLIYNNVDLEEGSIWNEIPNEIKPTDIFRYWCGKCILTLFNFHNYHNTISILPAIVYSSTSEFETNYLYNPDCKQIYIRYQGNEVYVSNLSKPIFIKYHTSNYIKKRGDLTKKFITLQLLTKIKKLRHVTRSKSFIYNYSYKEIESHEDICADYALVKYFITSKNKSTNNTMKKYEKKFFVYLDEILQQKLSKIPFFNSFALKIIDTDYYKNHIYVDVDINTDIVLTLNTFRRTNKHNFCAIINIDCTNFDYLKTIIQNSQSPIYVRQILGMKESDEFMTNRFIKELFFYFCNFKCNVMFEMTTNLYPDNFYAKEMLKMNLYLSLISQSENINAKWIKNTFIVNDQIILFGQNKKTLIRHLNFLIHRIKTLKPVGYNLLQYIKNSGKFRIHPSFTTIYDLDYQDVTSAQHPLSQTIIYSDAIKRCFNHWRLYPYRPFGSKYHEVKSHFEMMKST